MKGNALISIITPVFNGEKYIKSMLQSVINQKYKNFELILVDDGSTDNTGNICKLYAKKDKRIKYFKKNNSGVSDTRNFALKKIKGEYICFIDADDIVVDTFLIDLLELFKKGNAGLACCDIYKMSDENVIKLANKDNVIDFKNKNKYDFLHSKFGGYLCNKMYKSSIIKDNKLFFDSDISMCEDLLFIFKYLAYVECVLCLDKQMYLYRIFSLSASKNFSNIKWFSIFKTFDYILKNERLYTDNALNKFLFMYVLYLYQGVYRLKYIKDEADYFVVKKELYNRIKKVKYRKTNLTFYQKIKLGLYKKFGFLFKLKLLIN